MKITTNITNLACDMDRFKDGDAVKVFCKSHGLQGFELLPYEADIIGIIPSEHVVGMHMTFFNCWVDFWHGYDIGVINEYGNLETAKDILGENKQDMIARFKSQLDFAQNQGVDYVVFHVCDVSTEETLTYNFRHTDEEVIVAALELINAILSQGNYSFDFLVENLWWPGFNMTNPEITAKLLEGIVYLKKGIMLDTGHLLHTNRNLSSQEEAVEYIHRILDAHGDLCDFIKGIHLQQSLTGAYVEQLIKSPPLIKGTYGERMGNVYPYLFMMDAHKPFSSNAVKSIVSRIEPKYLTHEFITETHEEHEAYIRIQKDALGL